MKTWVIALCVLQAVQAAPAAESVLWEIGKPDHNTAKFALGPSSYKGYHQPGLFVVGQSDPKKDWPYVQPGIIDGGWAPGGPQTFEIVFAVETAPQAESNLELYFADTHSTTPPRLRVGVNGLAREFQTPRGRGDASIFGQPTKGRPFVIRMEIPAGTLKSGANRVAITTLTGSWVLWDAIRFMAPEGTKLAAVNDFLSPAATAPVDRLVWHEGKPAQAVTVRIYHSGEACEGQLRIGDQPPQSVRVEHGMQSVECFVPPVDKCETLPVSLTLGTAELVRSEIALSPVRKWEIYILMHSHNDIGYTDIQPNIAKKQAHNVLRALELIRKTKDYPPGARFKWNLEVLVPYEDFHAVATPDQEREFEQAVREGTIGVDAMYANLLTGVCRSEELLQQFRFAVSLGRRCGVKVDSMMISDVPGLTWGVVPALVQNGVKYISDGENYFDRIGYSRRWEDKPFYWLAPNGRDKVLYWAPYFGYAYGHTVDLVTIAAERDIAHLKKNGYPYDMVQMRWSKGDNGSADERVMDQVRAWNAKYAYPKFVIATTSEMFHEFESRYGDKVPTFRGDFTPYWEDGTASSAIETGVNRHSADRLLQAETMWALKGMPDFPKDDYAAAWKNIALYSEHTWGAHNSISHPDLPFVKTQWKYKQARALNADEQSRKLLDKVVASPAGTGSELDQAIDVFNTSSWPRTGLVTLPKSPAPARIGMNVAAVRDEQGNPVNFQYLRSGEMIFVAKDVPPFGAKRFTLETAGMGRSGAYAEPKNQISTPSLKVKLNDVTGAIESLKCAGIDAELVNGAVNSYVYLPGGNVKDAKPNGPATISRKENGLVMRSLLIESDAPGCKKLTREVRVIDGLDYVEIIDMVDKLPVRAVEGVHFGFAFNVPNPEDHINSPGAVMQPEKDQLPGACKNWFSVERWVDVSNAHYGVTWVTADAPLMEMGGLTANLPRQQGDPNAYMKTIAASPTLYSWAMNNHWETNSRAYQEGWTTFRYAVRPHGAYDAVAAARFGVESTLPLIAMPATGEKPLASRLKIDSAGVLATAFKPSDDGRAIIVRLYGASGKDATVKLTWSDPAPKKVWLSDASEQPLTMAAEAIEVPAWGIVTVRADLR